MNVSCPNCATVYRVDPAKVPVGGVRARCNVCSAVFAVRREGEAPAAPSQSPAPALREPVAAAAAPPRAEPPKPQPVPEPLRPEPPRAAPRPAAPLATPANPTPAPPRPVAPPRPAAPAAGPVARPTPGPASLPPAAPVARPVAAPPPPSAPAAPAAPRPASPAAAGPAAPKPAPPPPSGSRPTNPFLSQDPSLKARRLARALISDMVVYHPGKRQEGLRDGNLKELFEEEIKKSWEEYAEQVSREVAESTPYFREALNEILAGGRQIF